MRASTNACLVVLAVCALVGGTAKPGLKEVERRVDQHFAQVSSPVQRPTIDVRPALWTDVKLPITYSTVSYAGGCRDGSCSILGLARREASGEASGPVRRVFSGFRERQPVRRLFGRLRGRCG